MMGHDQILDVVGSNCNNPFLDDPVDDQIPRSSSHDDQSQVNKKQSSKITTRLGNLLTVQEAANPTCEEQTQGGVGQLVVSNRNPTRRQTRNHNVQQDQQGSQHTIPSHEGSTTSLKRKRGERGKYRCLALQKKTLRGRTKLDIDIPDHVLQAVGDNARELVNYCGYVVRTIAPMNVKNWAAVAASHGDRMWKQVQDMFKLKEASHGDARLQAFVIETMQRLYRYWKHELHAYYLACGETDEEQLCNPPEDFPQDQWKQCVEAFGSDAFKKVSERNKKNRNSENWCKHTTGSKSFPKVEHIMTMQNKGVKSNADVIWLVEHTHYNKKGALEWVNDKRSKGIHKELQILVQNKDQEGAPQTQEEMLVEVLGTRSGYVRGKGNGYKSSIKAKLNEEQQQKINEQQGRIISLEKELQEHKDNQAKEMKKYKDNYAKEMKELKDKQAQEIKELENRLMEKLLERMTRNN